jgi:hypothetical protein
MRGRLITAAVAVWGFALNVALTKGWLDLVPNWAVASMLAGPILVWGYLGLTHNRVRNYLKKTRLVMSLTVFVVVGAVIGGTAGGVIHKLLTRSHSISVAPSAEKPAQPTATVVPLAEKSVAAISPPAAAMAVPGEIGWNFSSFLGMSSGAYDAGIPAPQFRVQTFQASGRNIWSSTITKIEGYVEIYKTGERFPLLFNKEGTPVDLAQMPPIENDERTAVVCYFSQSAERSSWQGIEPDIFLDRYTPFTFVVSINGGEERKYPFSTENCRALIQSFIDSVSRPRN